MGNTSSQEKIYNQYKETINNKNKNIEPIEKLDPYVVMNVNKNFTWDELKSSYKKLALKTHPDKNNGDDFIFNFVTECFKKLAHEYKNRNNNFQHQELKNESKKFFDKINTNELPHPSNILNTDNSETFDKKFNKVFEECKVYDEYKDFGYSDNMVQRTTHREDFDIKNIFNKNKVDNNTFNDIFNKNVPISKEIIKYKEPESISITKNLQFTEIGASKPDDYSSTDNSNKSLLYTDYMKAYSGHRLADPNDINKIKKFKNVSEYEKYRDNKVQKSLTDKEKKIIEKKKIHDENKEFKRLERIRLHDLHIAEVYDKANRLLITK